MGRKLDPLAERPRVRSNVLCREVDDGFILYDPGPGKVHSLSPVAAFIWDALDGKNSLQEISENLEEFPGAEGHDILGDVLKTVDNFQREGLLEPPPDSPG
ncbi:PqqD family protein [Nitrospinota bacterium]